MTSCLKASAVFQDSYGGWNMLASFFKRLELLQLQSLNRKAYHTTISRVQTKWRLLTKVYFLWTAKKEFEHTFFTYSPATGRVV